MSAVGDTENKQVEINANGKPGMCFLPNILCVIIRFLNCRELRIYNTAIFPARKIVPSLNDRIKYVNISWHFTKKTETSGSTTIYTALKARGMPWGRVAEGDHST